MIQCLSQVYFDKLTEIRLWNLATGEELKTFSGHSDSVNAVAVTPNGKKVISGSGDKTLRLWNLATGKKLKIFRGHSGPVTAVAVTPNGKQVISGSRDRTLKLWNLETGEEILTFSGDSSIACCAVAPDGVTIVAGESSGRLHFLRWEGIETSPPNCLPNRISANN